MALRQRDRAQRDDLDVESPARFGGRASVTLAASSRSDASSTRTPPGPLGLSASTRTPSACRSRSAATSPSRWAANAARASMPDAGRQTAVSDPHPAGRAPAGRSTVGSRAARWTAPGDTCTPHARRSGRGWGRRGGDSEDPHSPATGAPSHPTQARGRGRVLGRVPRRRHGGARAGAAGASSECGQQWLASGSIHRQPTIQARVRMRG